MTTPSEQPGWGAPRRRVPAAAAPAVSVGDIQHLIRRRRARFTEPESAPIPKSDLSGRPTGATTESQRATRPDTPASRARNDQARRRRGIRLTDLAPAPEPDRQVPTREDLQQRLARRRAHRTGTEEK